MKTPTEFVEEWMKTICSNNVEAIVSMYKKEAVLLGTLDGKLRNGHTEYNVYSLNKGWPPEGDLCPEHNGHHHCFRALTQFGKCKTPGLSLPSLIRWGPNGVVYANNCSEHH